MSVRGALVAGSVGVLTGAAGGAAAGVGARVAMRMVADGVPDGLGQRPDFTLAGSVFIVVLGILAGIPFGILYQAIEPRLPGPRRVRGLAFGALTLAVIGPFFLRADELFTPGRVALFTVLFPLFGIVLGSALGPSSRIAARLPVRAQASIGAVGVVASGLVTIALALSIVSDSTM